MEGRLAFDGVPVEQDRRVSDVIAREQARLRQFIRARVRSDSDADEIRLTAEEERSNWEDLLPSPDAGPDALYARKLLLEELDAALDELPEEQRDVFVAHQLDGRSFKDLSEETGVALNTLLSRKRY